MSKSYKNRDERMKDIRRYLDGKMTGRERNAFERKLQGDPFEEEAVEGLSILSSEHLKKDMDLLDARLKRRVHKRTPFYYRIAAAVIVLMAVSSLLLVRELRKPPIMMSENLVELKDTTEDEPALEGYEATDKAENDISESGSGQALRQPAASEEEAVEVAGKVIVDDLIISGMEEEQEEAEVREAAIADIKDSVLIVESQLAVEAPGEARVAENIAEQEDEKIAEAARAETYIAGERAVTASKAKKVSQPAAPVKAGEQADMEISELELTGEEASVDAATLTDHPAEPLGGMKEFRTYLETDQIFPAEWVSTDREIVKLEIIIGAGGEIGDIKIIKSPGEQFSEEAIRLVREGPPWLAASKDSHHIEDRVKLRIVFKR